MKDEMQLKTPGVYSIPSECGQDNFGQTGSSIGTKLKDHHWYINLEHPDK
jgi:hypothetical protein